MEAQFIEALSYKQEGRRFDSRWSYWNFSLTYSFRPAKVDPGTMRSEYQEYFLGGKNGRYTGMASFQTSCVECFDICELQPPGIIRACPSLYRNCYTFVLSFVLSVCNRRRKIGEGCSIKIFWLFREDTVENSIENLKKCADLEDPDLDGRLILKRA